MGDIVYAEASQKNLKNMLLDCDGYIMKTTNFSRMFKM